MEKIAFYGGSFDPVHRGHLTIADTLLGQFELDEFTFIPAYHAPHKKRKKPTSAFDRYAMLCLATQGDAKINVSKMELEAPERPYSVETLESLNAERPDASIYFVMGADSWMEIVTWRQWEKVLSLSNHIIVSRPGVEIGVSHVTDEVRDRIIDLRHPNTTTEQQTEGSNNRNRIYITDSVNVDVSATEIRRNIREQNEAWRKDVPPEVANYLEKYQIYS
jgi:nicotinate-nucleotide adenylyltransferase